MIELLNLTEWYGVSKRIDFAKGQLKMPETLKEGFEQIKRQNAWRSKK